MIDQKTKTAALDVVVVMYRSADVIGACITSLLQQRPHIGRIVLVDNASPDASVSAACRTAERHGVQCVEPDALADPLDEIEILRSDENLGFAGGVNLGLKHLMARGQSRYFWILNPDCELMPGCAETLLSAAEAAQAEDGFALLGTRILYHGGAQIVQSDGGICCAWTGRCRNLNQGQANGAVTTKQMPECDFISGASMVASRRFVERSGLMPEEYFLYYEEVDWAMQRGDLPLVRCLDAVVQHHGGTAIGSGAHDRAPSPLSSFFNFRNRMLFMRRHHPRRLAFSYGFSLLKVMQMLWHGQAASAFAAFCGLNGTKPPKSVRLSFGVHEGKRAFAVARKQKNTSTNLPARRSTA